MRPLEWAAIDFPTRIEGLNTMNLFKIHSLTHLWCSDADEVDEEVP